MQGRDELVSARPTEGHLAGGIPLWMFSCCLFVNAQLLKKNPLGIKHRWIRWPKAHEANIQLVVADHFQAPPHRCIDPSIIVAERVAALAG